MLIRVAATPSAPGCSSETTIVRSSTRYDSPGSVGATVGRPLPRQPQHPFAADAVPPTRFDPAQRDRWVYHLLQRVEITIRPGAQPALDEVVIFATGQWSVPIMASPVLGV